MIVYCAIIISVELTNAKLLKLEPGISLLTAEPGIDQKYKQVIEKHIKFFADKERICRFYGGYRYEKA